ncbi:hypothetical protein OS188_00085 [Xanthomarina sp. F1114]|uniref:hypothetical protein n=1 Tax=Xanthomarina sp. F1114 TaxID=2996019 RepID=UPI00225DFBCE|nr:hypothetical protein [Xanthomarina sp. F1114]MCX7546342.1 hypothetical protein [Xanthomarina sp. F1114]
MKVLTYLVFILLSTHIFGQQMDSIAYKEIDVIIKDHFDSYSHIFKQKLTNSIQTENYIRPWDEEMLSENTLSAYLNTISNNAKIKTDSSWTNYNRLVIYSYLPEDDNKNILENFKFEIIKHNLIDSNNNVVNVEKYASGKNWSYDQPCNTTGKKPATNLCKKVDSQFKLEAIPSEQLLGDVLINTKFLSGYSHIKITDSLLSKSLSLSQEEFTIIEITDNKIVVLNATDKNEFLQKTSFVNLDKNGNRLGSKLIETKKKANRDQFIWQGQSSQTIDAYNYKLFKENPYLSYDTYKNMVREKLIRVFKSNNREATYKKEYGEIYTIINIGSNIENLYLYTPNYLEKMFTIQLK